MEINQFIESLMCVLFMQCLGVKSQLPVCEATTSYYDSLLTCVIGHFDEKFEQIPGYLASTLGGNATEILRATSEIKDTLNQVQTAMDNLRFACDDFRNNGIPATCMCSLPATCPICDSSRPLPHDCSDIKYLGNTLSGVYTIYPVALDYGISVYCDLTTSNKSWTVIQRRKDGSVNFTQNWNSYKEGFGNLNGEFWLGNQYIWALTATKHLTLRIDYEQHSGDRGFAEFSFFRVENEDNLFRLRVSDYSLGTAGEHFTSHNGAAFSTYDRDNDEDPDRTCATQYAAGWWFLPAVRNCGTTPLNNPYSQSSILEERHAGIVYATWISRATEALRFVEMKLY